MNMPQGLTIELMSNEIQDAAVGSNPVARFARHVLRDGDARHPGEALLDLLTGRDEAGVAMAAAMPRHGSSYVLLRRALAHGGLVADVALATLDILQDVRVVDAEGRQVFAAWVGGDGARHHRMALGSGLHVTENGDVLIPDLPETILSTLRGRRLGDVVVHPVLPADAVITAVIARRLWSTEIVRALQIDHASTQTDRPYFGERPCSS